MDGNRNRFVEVLTANDECSVGSIAVFLQITDHAFDGVRLRWRRKLVHVLFVFKSLRLSRLMRTSDGNQDLEALLIWQGVEALRARLYMLYK